MKILFFTKLYLPHVGGVEKHVEKVGKSLVQKGHKVRVLTEKYDKSLANKERKGGIDIVRLSYPKTKFLGLLYIWFWLWKNRDSLKDADIVHIHDIFIWYLPFRFLFLKKPVYTTFHGWEGYYPVPFKNILLKKLASKLSWKVIAVGGYIEKHYGIIADKIIYGGR